jgi:hypothetical protein
MMNLHFGYERDTELGLRSILGDGFWSRHLTISTSRPFADMPTSYGAIESRPIERVAIVIEGEAEQVAEYAAAIKAIRDRKP